ncbi:hypothetical protein NG697_05280 [Pseudarthrobacter sp. MDT3-26]|uniref:hypothetical protein n=1 Tax=Pseudarthrobacter raffinosi TaxID=2953651 RepID=UPI00208E11D5|nr:MULTISPECIES: hypothetical protein [unclassified Pseudarthrobacter]MCO4236421.1 hypothetical protein [Pseudarthrobacter sp. MDT3-28]MCO4262345.1 hypothetical protein [Pseudarthrobacter sp. MDT3-26]
MLSGLLGSAATPFIATWLLGVTHQSSSIAWYIMGASLVSLGALVILTETRYGNIDAVDESPVEAAAK